MVYGPPLVRFTAMIQWPAEFATDMKRRSEIESVTVSPGTAVPATFAPAPPSSVVCSTTWLEKRAFAFSSA